MSSILLKNIGTIVSGDISAPILDGDAILVEDGKINKVGTESALKVAKADVTIDCAGTTVTPGLFDSHCHVVLGDYTPRQKQIVVFPTPPLLLQIPIFFIMISSIKMRAQMPHSLKLVSILPAVDLQ